MTPLRQQRLFGALLLIILIGTSAWWLLDNVAKNHQQVSQPQPIKVEIPKKVIVSPKVNQDDTVTSRTELETKSVAKHDQSIQKIEKPAVVISAAEVKSQVTTPAAPTATPEKNSITPQTETKLTTKPVQTVKKTEKPALVAEVKPKTKPEPVKPSEQKNTTQWVMQVASFSQKGNAETIVKKLKAIGYSAMIDSIKLDSGKTLYRVRLADTDDKALLEKSAITIKEKLNITPQIQRYLP